MKYRNNYLHTAIQVQKWSTPEKLKEILQEDLGLKIRRKDLNDKLKIMEIALIQNNELPNRLTHLLDDSNLKEKNIRKNSDNYTMADSGSSSSSSMRSDSVVPTVTFPNVRADKINMIEANKDAKDNSKAGDDTQSNDVAKERTDVTSSTNINSNTILNMNSNRVSHINNDQNQNERIATFVYEVGIKINTFASYFILGSLSSID